MNFVKSRAEIIQALYKFDIFVRKISVNLYITLSNFQIQIGYKFKVLKAILVLSLSILNYSMDFRIKLLSISI